MKISDPRLLALIVAAASLSAEVRTLQVRAVKSASAVNERTSSYVTPGKSSTTCSSGALTTDCETTSTPAQTHALTTRSVDVGNVVEAEGLRYTIVCRASWEGSHCMPLREGDLFTATIDKHTMWIVVHKNGNQGKEVKIKYTILDIRPVPDSPTP
jgi:hypothetical protein